MFCENCGKPLLENAKFCTSCGAACEAVEEGAPLEGKAPVPKKRGKKAALIGVCALVLVLALGISAFASPVMGNFFAKTFSSPEKYFTYVQKNTVEKFAKAFGEEFDRARKNTGITEGNAEISLEIGEDLYTLLDATGEPEYREAIGWIRSLGLRVGAKEEEMVMASDATVSLNGVDLLSANMVMDVEEAMLYFLLPELSQTAIGGSLEYDANEMQEALEIGEAVLEALPEGKVLEKLITKYTTLAAEEIRTVSRKTETVEAGDVHQKMTVRSAKISEKTATRSARRVLEALLEDKEVEEILRNIAKLEMVDEDPDAFYAEFIEETEMALEELEEMEPSTDEMFKIKLYADAKGEVKGIAILENAVEFFLRETERGGKFGIELEADLYGDTFGFEGYGDKKGGKLTGLISIRAKGFDILTLSLEGVDEEKLEKGLLEGKVVIEPTSSVSGLLDLAGSSEQVIVDFLKKVYVEIEGKDMTEKGGTLSVSVRADDAHYGTVTLRAGVGGGPEIRFPETYVNAENSADMQAWAQNANLSGLLEKLRAAGVPEALLAQIQPPVAAMPMP